MELLILPILCQMLKNGRGMTLKRNLAIVAIAGLILVSAGSVLAGTVVIDCTPAGALATLTGEAIVSGVTPVRFQQPLAGKYELTVTHYGYETYHSEIIIDPSRETTVQVSLSPKTKYKAAVRSLFIPGWGQRYGDQQTKATVMTALAVGSIVGFFFADERFDNKHQTYLDVLSRYDSVRVGGEINQLRGLQEDLEQAQQDAYDAENVRRFAIGATIGVWAINMIDVLFFFPEERGTFSIKGLTVVPEASSTKVGFTLVKGF